MDNRMRPIYGPRSSTVLASALPTGQRQRFRNHAKGEVTTELPGGLVGHDPEGRGPVLHLADAGELVIAHVVNKEDVVVEL